jgi:hypothetical protein
MFPPILQDIDERIADLPRCRERPRMIPVSPHLPATAERAIDRFGNPDREALKTTAQSERLCFNEEVDVVALHAEVDQPESFRRTPGECGPDGAEDVGAPERRKTDVRAERDVHRASRIVRGASAMWDMPARSRGRSSRTVTPAAPRRGCRKFRLAAGVLHLE